MSTAASIALIFLIIEASFFALIFLAVVGGMVYGMHKLRGAVKRLMPRGAELTNRIYVITRQVSDKVASPFMAAHATSANVRTVTRKAKQRLNL